MTHLLKQLAVFLWHVIDAPESAPETRQTAEELVPEVIELLHKTEQTDRIFQRSQESHNEN